MNFQETVLKNPVPRSIRKNVHLPRRKHYYSSPGDWRDEVLYFLLVDRFSDGKEDSRQLLNRSMLLEARPGGPGGEPWRWDRWAESGAHRWQGGTIKGLKSQLGYLKQLGITAIWLSPVFKQRGHLDTYHGYGIQNFLDVDPRFGTRQDLVELVTEAHSKEIRIILDIIFNHSGENWLYQPDAPGGPFTPFYTQDCYPIGCWLGGRGDCSFSEPGTDDAAWPSEMQDPEHYTRAGAGDLGNGDINDPNAEHKRTDFLTLRDLYLRNPAVLADLSLCYKYWIALTDCDGFRIDTLKHVSLEEARNFCGSIKEFAANLGKSDFLIMGEIAGGDQAQDRYLDVLKRNLDAALDIGEMRPTLGGVAKGLVDPRAFFEGFNPANEIMGSHRNLGERHVSVLDDHDHVFGEKLRFSSDASSDHQVVAGVALQLFSLGVPCIYYGTEQAFAGPEPEERKWLPSWKSGDSADRYLREAMFGPEHPRKKGLEGLQEGAEGWDTGLPGFGPFGSSGRHCFDTKSPAFTRIAALISIRQQYPVLRVGRQYQRQLELGDGKFYFREAGRILAWSRILDDEEALCVVNTHGNQEQSANVLVDATLNPPGSVMRVLVNTAEVWPGGGYTGPHKADTDVQVERSPEGTAFVRIQHIPPSEVLVLSNHPGHTPDDSDGGITNGGAN